MKNYVLLEIRSIRCLIILKKMDEFDLNQQSEAIVKDCFYVGDRLYFAYGYDLELHLCHVPNIGYCVDSRIYDVFTDEFVGFIKPSFKSAFLSYYNGPAKDLFSKRECGNKLK